MTTATLRLSIPLAPAKTAPASLLGRFYNAFMEARMRAAMRELARHPYILRQETIKPVEIVPQDEVRRAGHGATFADAGMLPFVRGA
jgi:hypothetical protein